MGQDTNLANMDGERVDPSTEDMQRELLVEFGRQSRSTNDVVFQALTIGAASVAVPPEKAHGCNNIKLWTAASDMYIGDVDSQPFLLMASINYELHVNNTSNLRFKSATTGTIVYLMSSN